jgi:hypothetical protein
MCSLPISGPFILIALLAALLSPQSHAQTYQTHDAPASTRTTAAEPLQAPADSGNDATDKLPEDPTPHTASQPDADQRSGSITGTVLDGEGAEISDALVTLENTDSKARRMLTTDSAGSFKFDSIEPGRFNLTITSTGFAPWVSADLALHTGQSYAVPPIALQVASTMTDVEVTVTRHRRRPDALRREPARARRLPQLLRLLCSKCSSAKLRPEVPPRSQNIGRPHLHRHSRSHRSRRAVAE